MPNVVMPKFEYHMPENVQEVLALLDKYGCDAKIIAGGTDVLPKLKGGVMAPAHIISLREVKELRFIDYDCHDGLRFGANVKLRELENNPIVKSKYKALYMGCHSIASTQIRNIATLVGNVCNAVPSADSAPALLALSAKLKIVSSKGERIVPIEKFFTGVCKTVLSPNELVTEVIVPEMGANSGSYYFKYAVRRAMDLALVGVAAKITVENGLCSDAKIALGAVAITPKRAPEAEKMLIGQHLTANLIEQAARFASENECSPISDIRASREYRREMVYVLTRDAIKNSIVA